MKQKITLAVVAIMAVGICSCSEDESLLGNQNSSQAIVFDVPFVSKPTRTLVDNKNIGSQTLKVYGQKAPKGTTTWTTVFDGTQLSQVDGRWTPATSAYWYEYQDYRFVAVSPATAPFSYNTTTGFVSLPSVPAVQVAATGTDYLVSNQYTTTTNGQDHSAVNMSMSHMLSKLTLGIKKTSDYTIRVNSSKLWLPKETIRATYAADAANMERTDTHCWTYSTFANGGTAPSEDYKSYTCFSDNLTLGTESTDGTTYLVAPHANLGMFIDLDFDVLNKNGIILRNRKISKMAIKRSDMKLLSNTSYNITVNIKADSNADEVEFNTVSVKNWDVNMYYITCTNTGPVTFNVDGETYTVEAGDNKILIDHAPTSFKIQSGKSYLKSLDASHLDVSNVTNMSNMFNFCLNLTSLNLSGWDVSNVTNMSNMFYYCQSLTTLDVSGWDVSNVTDMSNMFYNCINLTPLEVSGWNVSNVTNMSYMFYYCQSLTALDVSDWNVSNVTNMECLFFHCHALTALDVSGWDVSNVTNMSYLFYICQSLTALDVSGWDVSNVTNMRNMFYYCKALSTLGVSSWNVSNVINMSNMFYYCQMLTTLDVSGWDVSNVTNMEAMFSYCHALTPLDVSGWDVSNVTNMERMFSYCHALTALDVSGWDVSNATNMYAVFYACINLTTLEVSGWDVSNVTNMECMFSSCHELTSLEVSGWDVSNVIKMRYMFSSCQSLITLDVSGWNVSNVTNMESMFSTCQALTILDVSGWDISNVTVMPYIFTFCPALTQIIAKECNETSLSKIAAQKPNKCTIITE